jgi:hypothetical protein
MTSRPMSGSIFWVSMIIGPVMLWNSLKYLCILLQSLILMAHFIVFVPQHFLATLDALPLCKPCVWAEMHAP